MSLPLVSIILPAYNCEKYIAASVASILDQVYDNFELIIVNDGSTDNTPVILSSITDQRVRVIHHETNRGLIESLNRGIDEARGEYTARMDADDLATNDRIEKQVHWLLHHPGTSAVASFIRFIDEAGNEKGDWPLDRQTFTAKAIRRVMPRENCLAHPSMMIRTAIIKNYRYDPSQKNIEDYDLWLRMLADGLVIDKLPQRLLYYREHAASITTNYLKNKNPFMQNYACKQKFLASRVRGKHWGKFETMVSLMMLRDRAMAFAKSIKRRVK